MAYRLGHGPGLGAELLTILAAHSPGVRDSDMVRSGMTLASANEMSDSPCEGGYPCGVLEGLECKKVEADMGGNRKLNITKHS